MFMLSFDHIISYNSPFLWTI